MEWHLLRIDKGPTEGGCEHCQFGHWVDGKAVCNCPYLIKSEFECWRYDMNSIEIVKDQKMRFVQECRHDWKWRGHDGHKDFYVCSLCDAEKWE